MVLDVYGRCKICGSDMQVLRKGTWKGLKTRGCTGLEKATSRFGYEDVDAAFASLWNSAIRFCSVRRLIPRS